jgi:hypothetical protein
MQWLTLVPEDAGVQRLRAELSATAGTGQLDAVARYPSAHPVQIGEQRASGAPVPRRERRRGERRQGARREQQLAGAFDTRSRHDRRGCPNRRRSAGETAATAMGAGIDVYA